MVLLPLASGSSAAPCPLSSGLANLAFSAVFILVLSQLFGASAVVFLIASQPTRTTHMTCWGTTALWRGAMGS